MDWVFLEQMMVKLGFNQKWIELVMLCVKSVNYFVLVNGNSIVPIVPQRGLRQGYPLPPYLFVIFAQGLLSLLYRNVVRGDIHDVKVCRVAIPISYLHFANGSFFFLRAANQECDRIKTIFSTYENASGQAINFNKSGVFFNGNMEAVKQV